MYLAQEFGQGLDAALLTFDASTLQSSGADDGLELDGLPVVVTTAGLLDVANPEADTAGACAERCVARVALTPGGLAATGGAPPVSYSDELALPGAASPLLAPQPAAFVPEATGTSNAGGSIA